MGFAREARTGLWILYFFQFRDLLFFKVFKKSTLSFFLLLSIQTEKNGHLKSFAPLGLFEKFSGGKVMCRKTMDIRAKHVKSDYIRRIESPGSRLGWKLLRVSVEQDEARKNWKKKVGVVKAATIRKYLHQEKKRAQLAKVTKTTEDTDKNEKIPLEVCEEMNPAALVQLPPPGAMAPENTTQYLMGNVYEDLFQNNVLHKREGSICFVAEYRQCPGLLL